MRHVANILQTEMRFALLQFQLIDKQVQTAAPHSEPDQESLPKWTPEVISAAESIRKTKIERTRYDGGSLENST